MPQMQNFFKKIVVGILTLEARVLLWRFSPKIIVVTGSVGKTSTKDAIYTAVASRFNTRKSEKSYNSEIGVPLTILGLPNAWESPFLWLLNILVGFLKSIFTFSYPEYLVLEVGADRPGDIRKLMKWLVPDMAVVTRFPAVPVHVEFYRDPMALYEEESFPVRVLKSGGILILNDDDEKVLALQNDFRGKAITYGLTPRAHIHALGDEVIYEKTSGRFVPRGIRFKAMFEKKEKQFQLFGALGIPHIYPILAGIASGIAAGVLFEEMSRAFEKHQPPLGRMRIIEGIKETTLIDDTYNSSPVAAEIALRTLGKVSAKRRLAALGDMKELGKYSAEEHKRIGALAAEICDVLVTVGIEARLIAEGALDGGMDEKNIFQFEESREAGKFLETILKKGDVILLKGSQSIRLERAVEEIMLHPENKEKLLVRQEGGWQRR